MAMAMGVAGQNGSVGKLLCRDAGKLKPEKRGEHPICDIRQESPN
jgi:hypothetical protein